MTGLDHKRASLEIREKFALTKEKAQQILAAIHGSDFVKGCVLISTCNRTELYVSAPNDSLFDLSNMLCGVFDRDFAEFGHLFTEKAGKEAVAHLCRVASGLDSQIRGDDQIISQVREALELSRGESSTDSHLETMFRLALQGAKAIKTKVILKSLGIGSVPGETVEKLKTICSLPGSRAVVIGNGQMGRLVAELLIRENVRVTVTLREYKKGVIRVPNRADTIQYSERYKAIEQADITVSATTSPHFTLRQAELEELARLPKVMVDLAVPRDVEPSVGEMPGLRLLTIDDIPGEHRTLPPESLFEIEAIIGAHVERYNRWLAYRENLSLGAKGGRV